MGFESVKTDEILRCLQPCRPVSQAQFSSLPFPWLSPSSGAKVRPQLLRLSLFPKLSDVSERSIRAMLGWKFEVDASQLFSTFSCRSPEVFQRCINRKLRLMDRA